MTTVADRVQAIEERNAQNAAPAQREYYGRADVLEGTRINLRASLRGRQPPHETPRPVRARVDPPPYTVPMTKQAPWQRADHLDDLTRAR